VIELIAGAFGFGGQAIDLRNDTSLLGTGGNEISKFRHCESEMFTCPADPLVSFITLWTLLPPQRK